MDLKDWAIIYIRNKDSFLKKLIEIRDENEKITARYKDKEEVIIIESVLNEKVFMKFSEGNMLIVCMNKKENAKFLIEHWKKFITFTKLKIIFVNPKENVFWIISPYIHSKVCDESSLRLGIKSLFESVECVE